MSVNELISFMSKSAEPNPFQRYCRRFHKLTPEQRRLAAELICNGTDPDKAIRKAKGAK